MYCCCQCPGLLTFEHSARFSNNFVKCSSTTESCEEFLLSVSAAGTGARNLQRAIPSPYPLRPTFDEK